MYKKPLACLLIFTFLFIPLKSEESKYFDSMENREAGPWGWNIHNGNKITTEFWNFGSISSPGNHITDIVWNGLGYGYEFGLLVTAEVEVTPYSHQDAYVKLDENGNPVIDTEGDTVWVACVISEGLMSYPEVSPDNSEIWGWEPVNGYMLENHIAMSDQPYTWPTNWNSWPGRFGDGIILADQESYFVIEDSYNKEFEFYPVADDSTIRGLGLTIECRYFQFSDPNLEDCLFMVYDITNIGDYTLNDIQIGFWGDPHIGGPANYADDLSMYNLEYNLAYAWDEDGNSDIIGVTPGYFGLTLIETPDNVGMQSFHAPPFFAQNAPRNDDYFWTNFLQPGTYDSTNSIVSGDFVFVMGSGMFSIGSGETKTVSAAMILGSDYNDLIQNTQIAQFNYPGRLSSYPLQQHDIDLIYPSYNDVISGSVSIQWNSTSFDGNPLFVDIYYNSNNGGSWELIAEGISDIGTYSWDTETVIDGYNYQLLMYAYNDSTSGVIISEYFIINNPANEVGIEVLLLQPNSHVNNPTLSGNITFGWRAGDADGAPVTINITHNDGEEYFIQNEVNDGICVFQSTDLANGWYSFRIDATDGYHIGESNVTGSILIHNEFESIPYSAIDHSNGYATGIVSVNIINSSNITGHIYEISIDDSSETSLTYDVLDMNAGEVVLENGYIYSPESDGPLFDGLRLNFDNQNLNINYELTGWTENSNCNLVTNIKPFNNLLSRRYPADYEIRFFDELVDSSSQPDHGYIKTNFEIWETTDSNNIEKRLFIVIELSQDSLWTPGERVIILQDSIFSVGALSWEIILNYPTDGETIMPILGDIYQIFTYRPFTSQDTYQINTSGLTIKGSESNIPNQYSLNQNYPNPFNPNTTINFTIPTESYTRIVVYDIMGRKVKELINSRLTAGSHNILWNGKNNFGIESSTGIYFAKMTTPEYSKTIKMVLMK
ncbi:MAG: T9SS type A sorting domain-containing protein [Candidatus Marinimicrobia bacterium]|nr:T9SS type A sorting domain-containing protein [Candidatus Neomarinimicrobiota bacterium]